MKWYFFYLTIFFNVIHVSAQIPFNKEMDVTRISTNFNGSLINDNNIFVYGQGGIILKTSNFGESWSKIQLNDSLIIVDMVKYDNAIYGICASNYLIKSTDNGNTWDSFQLGNFDYYQIDSQNELLYILSKNKVQILNKNIELVEEIPFQSDTNSYNFALVNNFVVISGGFGKITIINKLNGVKKFIDLKNLSICNDCKFVSKILKCENDSFYFIMGTKVYLYNLSNDEVEELNTLKKIDGASFASNNNKLYSFYSQKNYFNLDSLFLLEIDPTTEGFKRINNSIIDRYINNLYLSNLNFISNDTIIAVGRNNLIYMSFDGGVNWNLKSFLGFDAINIFAFDVNNAVALSKYAQIFHTSNSGVTWLPQNGFTKKYYDNSGFQYPRNSGGTYNFKDKNNGFIYIDPKYVGDTNIVHTNDGGNIVKLKSMYDFYKELDHYSFNHMDKFYIASYGNLPLSGGDFTLLFRLNDTLGLENKIVLKDYLFSNIFPIDNSLYAVGRESDDETNSFSIFKSNDFGNNWNKLHALKINVLNKDIFWMFTGAKEVNKDLFLFFFKTEIQQNDTIDYIVCYFYNTESNKFKEIYKINAVQNSDLYRIKDIYYVSYLYDDINGKTNHNIIFSKNIQDEAIIWDTLKYSRYTKPTLRNSNNDSIFYFATYDSVIKNSVLFLAKKKGTSDIEVIESIESNQIYFSNPFPMPSNGNFMINIFWDQSLIIDDVKFELTNILGVDCSNYLSYELYKKNNYSGFLDINISSLTKGLYILNCKINGKVYSKPIILE